MTPIPVHVISLETGPRDNQLGLGDGKFVQAVSFIHAATDRIFLGDPSKERLLMISYDGQIIGSVQDLSTPIYYCQIVRASDERSFHGFEAGTPTVRFLDTSDSYQYSYSFAGVPGQNVLAYRNCVFAFTDDSRGIIATEPEYYEDEVQFGPIRESDLLRMRLESTASLQRDFVIDTNGRFSFRGIYTEPRLSAFIENNDRSESANGTGPSDPSSLFFLGSDTSGTRYWASKHTVFVYSPTGQLVCKVLIPDGRSDLFPALHPSGSLFLVSIETTRFGVSIAAHVWKVARDW